ncbi:hypothetical protein D3C80_1380240 [compost metagenome]
MTHIHGTTLGECFHQADGQHQIAQTQCRKRHLAKRADIEHPPLPVQRRQGGQRGTAVAVLAVVVVLDDPAACPLGPRQQLQAPGQAHDHAGRVLM